MRCPLTHTSKTAFNAKPKQCKNMASEKICLPTSATSEQTEVHFVRVCMAHKLVINTHKIQSILQLNRALHVPVDDILEAEVISEQPAVSTDDILGKSRMTPEEQAMMDRMKGVIEKPMKGSES